MDDQFAVADPRADDVQRLIGLHLAFTSTTTPADFAFALEHDELSEPSVTLYGLRARGALIAIGALKHLSDTDVELKSMHTAEQVRGRGYGRRMLENLVAAARARGYRRISLETGSTQEFAPARALYTSAGFVGCPPFADYNPSDWNTFMVLHLH